MQNRGIMALALVAGGCAAGSAPLAVGSSPIVARDDFRNLPERLLAVHNRERAAAGVPPLRWDAGLAAGAQAYAAELGRTGRLVHSARQTRQGAGENLWRGTAGAFSAEHMADDWARERRMFRPGVFPNVSTTGNWADVAHYTQMIWRTTERVGCGLHRSAQWDYLVCRYAPAGNVDGVRVP